LNIEGALDMSIPKIPFISEEERTPVVVTLLEVIHLQQEMIQQLRDEIAILKGQKPKPKIKPSQLEKDPKDNEGGKRKSLDGKRPGSEKRQKTKELIIHEEKKIKPEHIPERSIFKGYQEYVVQDLIIQPYNTKYLLERWQTPEGDYIVGKLPQEVSGTHFGPTLTSFILYQYYQGIVTEPLILEELEEFGVDISSGQINNIITEGKDKFHAEKEEILKVGLEISRYINVDDTSARHQGRNGYCTHIGNELFAWFESTDSKSRINFLKLLRASHSDYILNDDALSYMAVNKLPKGLLAKFEALGEVRYENDKEWEENLQALQITEDRHIRIATEGALLGSVTEHGFNKETVIVSDDAGQFNLFLHALCWVHADRVIEKLVGYSDNQKEALEETRSRIWKLYTDLKEYKKSPTEEKKSHLEAWFDEIFTTQTCFASLNQALKRLHGKKAELLLVLERPEIPLHNNLSENDIREYAKRRKTSGSTRSFLGRRCRDTFVTLKKTCRKMSISFWVFINDRVSGKKAIPWLPDLIRLKAQELSF
jgi:hypothetical protein